jgi:hypothetical protein
MMTALSFGGMDSIKSNNFWVCGIIFWGMVTRTKKGRITRIVRIK